MRSLVCLACGLLLVCLRADDKPSDPSLSNKEPLKANAERETFKLAKGMTIQLVTSEPNLVDPVAFSFDEDGKLYVAEMRGYPNGGIGSGTITSGSIRLLVDRDGDGVYEKATVFTEGLRFPMSVLPWKGGILVAVAPDLIWLADTDGDGKADKKKVLYTGFDLANIQQMVNSLTWGLDGWIYGVAGSAGGTVKSVEKPDAPAVTLRSRGFRFRPDVPGSLEPTSGGGQYGLTSDPWGRWFVATNSQHLRHIVLPDHALRRNPALAVRATTLDIAEHGAACKVFRISPFEAWRVERTRRRKEGPDSSRFVATELVPGGFVTSGCSPLYYDGGIFPKEYENSIFVCDPANNLILRDVLSEHGATFIARRGHADQEFLASTDNWFRPTWLAHGPDGAIYASDFYREVIETPLSLPDDIKKRLNLESRARGRIWRIAPDGFKAKPMTALSKLKSSDLVALLAHANVWQRFTAQRLLQERQDRSALVALGEMAKQKESARGRAHALWLLQQFKALPAEALTVALGDAEAGVREQALRIVEERLPEEPALLKSLAALADDPSPRVRFQLAITLGASDAPERMETLAAVLRKPDCDTWTQTAVFSSCGKQASDLLTNLLDEATRTGTLSAQRLATATAVASLSGTTGTDAEVTRVLKRVLDGIKPGTIAAWRFALVEGLGDGLRASGRSLTNLRETAAATAILYQEAKKIADSGKTLEDRVAAIRLLGHAPFADSEKAFRTLLAPQQPPEIQLAVVRALTPLPEKNVAALLLERWNSYSPTIRRECTEALFARAERLPALLDAVEKKEVLPNHLEPVRIVALRKHRDEALRARAEKLFAGAASQRQKVLDAYQAALDLKSDSTRGKLVFKKNCATCHRLENEGHQVGADLQAALRNKTREQLILDILDPSREVDPRFQSYLVETKRGQSLSGLLAAETATSITLRRGEAAEDVLLRTQIDTITATGLSLMPDNLETQINKQDLADLMEYLLKVGR